MNIELYHTTEELKRMFRKEKDPRLAVRIQAIYLGLMGKTAVETAELLVTAAVWFRHGSILITAKVLTV